MDVCVIDLGHGHWALIDFGHYSDIGMSGIRGTGLVYEVSHGRYLSTGCVSGK